MNVKSAICACLVLFACAPVVRAWGQADFVDAQKDHWAYEAMHNLQERKILLGYPDGHFRGRRTLTRYEFAEALDRALKTLGGQTPPHSPPRATGPTGENGPAGERGAAGESGPAGVRPQELDDFRRLAQTFKDELARLGTSLTAVNRRLDGVAKDIADLKAALDRMPRIFGSTWLGMRSANADGGYVDEDGRFTPQVGQQFPRYSLMLGIAARLGPSTRTTPRVRRRSALLDTDTLCALDLTESASAEPEENSEEYRHSKGLRISDTLRRLDRSTGFDPFIRPAPRLYVRDDRRDRPVVPDRLYRGSPSILGIITYNNLREYYSGSFATVMPLKPDPSGDAYLQKLELKFPFSPIGHDGKLEMGRIPIKISPLTLYKPDVDTYFDIPYEDRGSYMMDGAMFHTKFCHQIMLNAFAGQFSSVTGTHGPAWNSPIAGVDAGNGGFGQTVFSNGLKTAGQLAGLSGNALIAGQIAGVTVGAPFNLMQGGYARFSTFEVADRRPGGFAGGPNGGFNAVKTLGSDFHLKPTKDTQIDLNWAKTMTLTGRTTWVGLHQNNAFNAGVNYGYGSFNANAGYRYIDPLFYAPGYWGRIGNWLNPTNIQGPYYDFSYNVSKTVGLTAGGQYFTAVHDRAIGPLTGNGGLGRDDNINRILVGLRWDVSKNFRTTIDWEGVYWSLAGNHTGIPNLGTGTVHPTEHYITLGTSYNLTSNTRLKLSYQIGDFNGHGAIGAPSGTSYNFNTFTTQLNVRF